MCDQTAASLRRPITLAAKILCANKDLVDWAVCKFGGKLPFGAGDRMRARIDEILSGAPGSEWPIVAKDATDLHISDGYSDPCYGDDRGTNAATGYEYADTTGANGTDLYYYDNSPLGDPSLLATAVMSYDGFVNFDVCNLAAVLAHELTHFVDPNYDTGDADAPGAPCELFTYAVRSEVLYYLRQRYVLDSPTAVGNWAVPSLR